MRNLFIILLLVPITMFGQVKKEIPNESTSYQLDLDKLNHQFKREQTGRGFQLFGLGMMSYGFLSNYILSKKEVNLEMSFDESNDEIASRLEKIQNNELISGLGALISSIGIVIPMNLPIRDQFYIRKSIKTKVLNPAIELHVLNGDISLANIKSNFIIGDRIVVKTLNGPVLITGALGGYYFDRIKIYSDEGVTYTLYFNILEYLRFEVLE